MAFRKRNVGIGRGPERASSFKNVADERIPGVRPSTITSHPVTSTGSTSLDSLLGGHGGLALGSSLLIEESGTTDFAGALLRYYAAEGICHGHVLHLVGVGESWIRELPGLAEEKSRVSESKASTDAEKMKIAWRYERLGQAGERALPDGSFSLQTADATSDMPFCRSFDLTKRLTIPRDAEVNHIQIASTQAPFDGILKRLEQCLKSSPPNSIHRLVIPTILSPAIYPPHASRPNNFIRFFQALRALLRQYPNQLTSMTTLPLELYPRNSGLVRWAEILSDGVLEFTPFPHLSDATNSLAESGGARATEEQPQGMVKVHKLPINTERGEGGAGAGAGNSIGEDLAFTVSRRKFVIKPFSLPPLEGDQDGQKEAGQLARKEVEF